MLQKTVVGSFNVDNGGYNIGGYNSGGGYNVGSHTMVVSIALYKQLCWKFEVSHNCICIIPEGPLMYVVP